VFTAHRIPTARPSLSEKPPVKRQGGKNWCTSQTPVTHKSPTAIYQVYQVPSIPAGRRRRKHAPASRACTWLTRLSQSGDQRQRLDRALVQNLGCPPQAVGEKRQHLDLVTNGTMNLLARYLQASPAVAGSAKGSFLSSLHIDVRIFPSYVHPARNPPSDHVSLPFDQPSTLLPQVSPEMWQVSLHQAGELGNPQPDPM